MSISDRLNYAKMKSRHQKELLPWYKKWWGIFLIILAIIIITILIFSTITVIKKTKEILNEKNTDSQEMSTASYLKTIEGDGSNYFLGPKQSFYSNYINKKDNSIIDIVVFSNFSCQFSAESAVIMRDLANEYPDVRFVFRDSPTQDSIILAIAARCAGEQNKFWEMHDLLFEMQEDMSLVLDEDDKKTLLLQIADIIDLNVDNFSSCLEERRYLNKIKTDYEDGESLKIPGTPTWYVNGQQILGTLPEQDFKELIIGLENEINK